MKISAASTLRDVAFMVCTALARSGAKVVLTGGGAATVWAPRAVQSLDLDFVFVTRGDADSEALASLGYSLSSGQYVHPVNHLVLEFPKGPLTVGGDPIDRWDTLTRKSRLLHVLTPTDSCRDRLAGFLFWNDRGSLAQAVAVATAQRDRIDFALVEKWCRSEGHAKKYEEFLRHMEPPKRSR